MKKRIKKNAAAWRAGGKRHERRPRGWSSAGARSTSELDRQQRAGLQYVNDVHEALMLRGQFGIIVRPPRLVRHG